MLKNSALFLATTALTLVIAECVLQLAAPLQEGVLFFSERFLYQAGTLGEIAYSPGRTIRSVAIYGGKTAYDVVFHTNNAGLIDDLPYPHEHPASRQIAIAGDSFTAGFHGGSPWILYLRKSLQPEADISLYNLGVGGTGVIHAVKLLDAMSGRLGYNEIIIAPITNDFYRGYWVPLVKGDGIRLCREGLTQEQCLRTRATVNLMGFQAGIPELVKSAETHIGRRSFSSRLRIPKMVKGLLRGHTQKWYGTAHPAVRESLAALRSLRKAHPDIPITLAHIPEKMETKKQMYALEIGPVIEAMGIRYAPLLTECEWSADMYFTLDAHPNHKGYENLTRCMADVIAAR